MERRVDTADFEDNTSQSSAWPPSADYISNLHKHRKAWRISIGISGWFAIAMSGRFERNMHS